MKRREHRRGFNQDLSESFSEQNTIHRLMSTTRDDLLHYEACGPRYARDPLPGRYIYDFTYSVPISIDIPTDSCRSTVVFIVTPFAL